MNEQVPPQPVMQTATGTPPRDLSRYKEEPVPGGALLVAAYAVLWLLVGVFVARVAFRQARLERDLRAMEDRLADPDPQP